MAIDESALDMIAASLAAVSASAERNQLYATLAKGKGRETVALLLKAVAASEAVNVRRSLMHLRGKVGDLDAHLEALAREKFDTHASRYPKIATLLRETGSNTTGEMFEQFGEVAKNQYDLLSGLKEGDPSPSAFFVCQVCGYIKADESPPKCPICGAVAAKFQKVAP